MSVLNRRLFSRGGKVSSQGVGITSGLDTPKRGYVDGPGSYQGKGEENLPGTAGLLDLDSDAVNTGYNPNLDPARPEVFMGTTIPSLELLMQRNLPIAQSIFGEPAKPTPPLQRAAPALLSLGSALLAGKSYRGGLSGALEILGGALQEATPAISDAAALKRAEEAQTRAEQVEAAKLAYSTSVAQRSNILDQVSSLASTKLSLDQPKVGNTLFLVPKDKPGATSKDIVMAYEKEETLDGVRVKRLYDFNGDPLQGEFIKYTGKDKPKDVTGLNFKFTVEEDGETRDMERMGIGRSVFNDETGQYDIEFFYTDDEGNEQRLPGNAVIVSRQGDASNIGQTRDRKEADELLTLQIQGTKFISQAIEAYNVIKDNPAAITDVGSIASFANRIIADAKAIMAVTGGKYEIDDQALLADDDLFEKELGIASDKLKSVFLDLAITRAIFKEGGERVTDQDVRNQLRIIGAYSKDPRAALVLLRDFITSTAREYDLEHSIRAERNELIDSVNENYLLRNFDLPFGTTGTVLEGNKDNITIGPGDDEEILEIINKVLADKDKDK